MKKLLSIIASAVLLFSAASCSFLDTAESNETQTETEYGRIAFDTGDNVLTDIVLKGTDASGTEKTFGSWTDNADLKNAESVKVPVGNWNFTLTLKKDGVLYSGTASAVINKGETANVVFEMKASGSEGEGEGGSSVGSYEAPIFTGDFYPANESTDAFIDTDLYVAYASDIEINTEATEKVTIYAGDALVDEIAVKGESYKVAGCNKTVQAVKVDDQLVQAVGNVLVIKPHALLTAGTEYTVTVPEGIVKGQAAKSWKFTPKAIATPAENTFTVGTDCASINGALQYLMSNNSTGDWTINVPAGDYHEILGYYHATPVNLKIKGADDNGKYGSKSRVFWRNNQNMGNSQRTRQSFIWEGGNLTIENMTFCNTSNRKVEGNTNVQAETLYFDCKADLVVYNSSFSSYQDTLLLGNNGGRAWFYKCLVEGDVDFIWGYTDVALFENCKIICLGDGIKNDAKIFASRTVSGDKTSKGFVLYDSDIIIQDKCNGAYGRSSGADTQASVVKCRIKTEGTGVLSPALWGSKSDTVLYELNGEMAVGYKDYGNTVNGKAVDTSNRLAETGEMSARLANREYNGRWAIVNREYNKKTVTYETKANIWDINTIATAYNAPVDVSKKNIYVDPTYSKNVVGGGTVQLTPSTTDDGAVTYTYASSNESVATVNETGLVTTAAGKSGLVTITVTGSNGNKDTAQVQVISEAIPAKSVTITDAPETLNIFQPYTVKAVFDSEDVTVKDVTWTTTGDIKIIDAANKNLVDTLDTTEQSVTIMATGTGTGTITAASKETPAATTDTKNVTVTEIKAYNTWEGYLLQNKDLYGILNFQKGKSGIWHDIVVDATTSNTVNGQPSKIQATSTDRIQARNAIFYIPVTGNCTIEFLCSKKDDTTPMGLVFTDGADGSPEVSENSTAASDFDKYSYKFTYNAATDSAKTKSGSELKTWWETLVDGTTRDHNRTLYNGGTRVDPNESATYFVVNLDSVDHYINTIKVTPAGAKEPLKAADAGTYSWKENKETLKTYTLSANGFQMVVASSPDQNASYGWTIKNGDVLKVNVSGNCTFKFAGSKYSAAGSTVNITCSDAGATATGAPTDLCIPVDYSDTNNATDGLQEWTVNYTGGEGTVTFTFSTSNTIYTPYMTLSY